MKYFRLLALGFFLGNLSCSIFRTGNRHARLQTADNLEVYGHRGEAGHYPENSIAGFLSAVQKGVQAIEMDVVISADKKVVVSHEAFMSSDYVSDPDGNPIPGKKELEYNLYKMDYDSIRQYETGLRKNRHFTKQKKLLSRKPLLEEVIDSVEDFISSRELKQVNYMIEIKSDPVNYQLFQPEPSEFANLVMEVVIKKGIEDRAIIKSFDPNLLNFIHKKYPSATISFLVSKKGIAKNLARLDFIPAIYSPRYKLVKNEKFVDSIKSRNMKLIPWTVNRKKAIEKMIDLKVDGIITDYPEKAMALLNQTKT